MDRMEEEDDRPSHQVEDEDGEGGRRGGHQDEWDHQPQANSSTSHLTLLDLGWTLVEDGEYVFMDHGNPLMLVDIFRG